MNQQQYEEARARILERAHHNRPGDYDYVDREGIRRPGCAIGALPTDAEILAHVNQNNIARERYGFSDEDRAIVIAAYDKGICRCGLCVPAHYGDGRSRVQRAIAALDHLAVYKYHLRRVAEAPVPEVAAPKPEAPVAKPAPKKVAREREAVLA